MKLFENIEEIKTTNLSHLRIKEDLELEDEVDPLRYCVEQIINADDVQQCEENWYIKTKDCFITINASTLTIISANKL